MSAKVTDFQYNMEIVNSIPDEVTRKSHLWRSVREHMNVLVEPQNRGKVLKIEIEGDYNPEQGENAVNLLRGAIYSWKCAADLDKRGLIVRTTSDKRTPVYALFVQVLPA